MPSRIDRRFILRTALLGAAFPRAWAAVTPCHKPGILPLGMTKGPYNKMTTAEEATANLDLSGKIAVVTGCNSGLGYETMRVLALRGAHVIGTARTAQKGADACNSVEGNATPVVLELSDFDSVLTCAQSIKDMDLPIDMLICNAGIMAPAELTLAYGVEIQFAVNHLSHFLFSNELLESVQRSNQGRVVIVSSCAHEDAPDGGIDFDNLDGSQGYSMWDTYARSKLANGLYAAELARRIQGTTMTANSVHPGVIRTNIARFLTTDPEPDSFFDKSVAQGAATQCYVAAHPSLSDISGQYFVDCNPAVASDLMYDKALAAKLWSVSESLIDEALS